MYTSQSACARPISGSDADSVKLGQKPTASNQQLRIRSSIPICSSDSDSTKLGQNPSAPYQNSEVRSSSRDEPRSSRMLVATKLLKDRLDPKTFHYYPSFFSFSIARIIISNVIYSSVFHCITTRMK